MRWKGRGWCEPSPSARKQDLKRGKDRDGVERVDGYVREPCVTGVMIRYEMLDMDFEDI